MEIGQRLVFEGSSQRNARRDVYIYIYIYIYLNNGVELMDLKVFVRNVLYVNITRE
jgi:hypothetical protein